MGSYRGTCHLSGMAISENEDVILLPISYGTVSDTSTFCYGTNSACHPHWLPFFGKYNGYGNIENVKNEVDLNYFRSTVNHYLFNNERFIEKPKFGYLTSLYCIFSGENNRLTKLEFLNDTEILKNFNKRTNLDVTQAFDNNETLLNYLTSNYLCKVSGDVKRIGYILIKESFFNAMIENSYLEIKEDIIENINNFLFEKHEYDEMINGKFYQDLSIESFRTDTLLLFNDHNSISYDLFKVIKGFRKKIQTQNGEIDDKFKSTINKYTQTITNLALILHMYADIGKSFYPNTSPLKNMSALNDFANVLSQEIEKVKDQNIKNFKANNGDVKMPEYVKWQAPYIDYFN